MEGFRFRPTDLPRSLCLIAHGTALTRSLLADENNFEPQTAQSAGNPVFRPLRSTNLKPCCRHAWGRPGSHTSPAGIFYVGGTVTGRNSNRFADPQYPALNRVWVVPSRSRREGRTPRAGVSTFEKRSSLRTTRAEIGSDELMAWLGLLSTLISLRHTM